MKSAIKRAAEKGTSTQLVKKSKSAAKSAPKKYAPRNFTSVNLGLGFPKRVTCTLKYAEVHTITSTTGALASISFSANGLYDPFLGTGGHQPLYFDQLMALYDHYTVVGSKIRCQVVPGTTNQLGSCALFIDDDNSTSLTDISAIAEQSSGTSLKILPLAKNEPTILQGSWSAKKTFGGSVLGNDNLQGTISANPTEQSVYRVCYQDLGAVTSAVKVIVEIEYFTVFDELKDVAQS